MNSCTVNSCETVQQRNFESTIQRLLCDLQNVVLIFTINSIRAKQLVQHYERHVNLIRKFFGRHDTPSAVVN